MREGGMRGMRERGRGGEGERWEGRREKEGDR